MLGIMRQLPALGFPETLTRLMLVAKVAGLRLRDQFDVSVAIVTPNGTLLAADNDSDAMSIDLVQDYVMVTIRGLPITECGSYTFRLQMGGQPPIDVELPVIDASAGASATVH